MPLETASTIADLVSTNPVGASDTPAALDDHIRLIKTVLKADALVDADIGVNVAAQSHNHTGTYAPVGAVTSSGLTQSTAKLLGRTTAGTGALEEITVGSGLSLSSGSLTGNGFSSLGQVVISTNTTLGSSQAGRNIVVLAGGITLTLPSTAATYAIQNASGGLITLSFPGGSDYKTTMNPGDSVILCGDGVGYWRSYGGSNSSISGFSTNGYAYIGNGLILQWATVIPSGGAQTLSFPVAFPTSCLKIVGQHSSGHDDEYVFVQAYSVSTSQYHLSVRNAVGAASATQCNIIAIGY